MANCNTCGQTSSNSCGCINPTDTKCVTWKGASVSCGDFVVAKQGDLLNEIIENLTDLACGNITPSGDTVVVDNVDGETTVAENTVGSVTTYTVGIDEDIITQIEDNATNISEIFSCLNDTVRDLTSSSLIITETSSNTCGRVLNVEYSPSGQVSYDGIVYSNITPSALPSGSGGDQTIATFNRNYVSLNNIADGDQINFRITGRIKGNGLTSDSMKIDVYDVSTTTILTSQDFNSFTTSDGVISSYEINGKIIVDLTNSAGLLSICMNRNTKDKGEIGDVGKNLLVIDDYFTGTNYQNLSVIVRQVNDSLQNATDNNVSSVVFEVRKKI